MARGDLASSDPQRAHESQAFLSCYDRLVGFLTARLGDRELARDIAQETLVRALEKRDSFDPSRNPWPWLKTIGINLAIDHLRARSKESVCDEITVESVETGYQAREDSVVLGEALKRLPPRQRIALSLKYLDDWRSTEAADFLGLSRAAFDQLLSRARRRLSVEYKRLETTLKGLALSPLVKLRLRLSGLGRRLSADPGGFLGSFGLQQLSQILVAAIVVAGTVSTGPQGAARGHVPIPGQPVAERGEGPREKSGTPQREAKRSATTNNGSMGSIADQEDGNSALRDVTDPNHGVEDPEDTRISSLAAGGDGDQIVYAAGRTHCRTATCPPVLFKSGDRGASWKRLPAEGFLGAQISVPQGAPHLIFAMGPTGLQISRDGGLTFSDALPTGVPMTTGSIAVSPLFARGDPTVLVGTQTLLTYSDSDRSLSPYPAALTGPFEPAFSPAYASDSLFLLGGLRQGALDGLISVISVCNPRACHTRQLPVRDQVPRLLPVGDERKGLRSIYAYTQDDLFVSHQGLIHYRELETPWATGTIRAMGTTPGGGLIVAGITGNRSSVAGIYLSKDEAESWIKVDQPMVSKGATDILISGRRILLALRGAGLACSTDGGRTFRERC